MSWNFRRILMLSTVFATPVLGQVHAQTAAAPGAGKPLEEVVVTAQKRRENIQNVPISIVALSGAQLAQKAVKSLADLQFAAPSLTVTNAGLTQSVNIRGIGLSSGSPNAANGVATYVDGVFQPPIVSNGQYYDIADIEVLRGPQGTFVGSNSTGGAVLIVTQSPVLNKFTGFGQVGVGSYGSFTQQAAVNVPLGDVLAFRVAVNHANNNSYYKSVGPVDSQAGKLTEFDERIGATYRPGDYYQGTFKFDQIERSTGGYAYQPTPGTAYASDYTGPSGYYVQYDSPTENEERAVQGSLNQQVSLPYGITLKSVTGYENKQIHNQYDTDGTDDATVMSTENQFVREKVYTQEFNLLSATDQRLSWIGGVYFQRNRIDVIIHDGPFPTDILVQNKKTTTGVFGQVSYKVTNDVTLTGGLRYSTYKVLGSGRVVIGTGIPSFPPGGLDVANTGGAESDSAPTGKIDIDWRFAPNNLFYAFASRGYKSGGIETATTNFLKETVWDYEAGWKSNLLGGMLKPSLGVFYNDYDNFQYDTVNPLDGQSAVDNASGTTTIDGVEGQIQALVDNWRFDGSFAYVHSVMANYTVIDENLLPPGTLEPQCATGQTVGCTNYTGATKTISGAPNLLSPDFTFNGGAQYTFAMDNGLSVTPRLNYAYQTKQDATPARDSFYVIPARGLLSALVTVDYGPWSGQFSATNLTGERYVTGYTISGASGGSFYGAPREFNFNLRRDF